jgi:hypothetical protein
VYAATVKRPTAPLSNGGGGAQWNSECCGGRARLNIITTFVFNNIYIYIYIHIYMRMYIKMKSNLHLRIESAAGPEKRKRADI